MAQVLGCLTSGHKAWPGLGCEWQGGRKGALQLNSTSACFSGDAHNTIRPRSVDKDSALKLFLHYRPLHSLSGAGQITFLTIIDTIQNIIQLTLDLGLYHHRFYVLNFIKEFYTYYIGIYSLLV